MLDRDDLWLMDQDLSLDEPPDVLEAMPGMRQLLDPDRHDDELGLRSMLESPEQLSRSWWRTAKAHPRRAKRRAGVPRAA